MAPCGPPAVARALGRAGKCTCGGQSLPVALQVLATCRHGSLPLGHPRGPLGQGPWLSRKQLVISACTWLPSTGVLSVAGVRGPRSAVCDQQAASGRCGAGRAPPPRGIQVARLSRQGTWHCPEAVSVVAAGAGLLTASGGQGPGRRPAHGREGLCAHARGRRWADAPCTACHEVP